MVLLRSHKDQQLFLNGYYTLITLPLCLAGYNLLIFRNIKEWYWGKIVKPSVLNEVANMEE